jgi:hypothetical protein
MSLEQKFLDQRNKAFAITQNRQWNSNRVSAKEGYNASYYPEYYAKNLLPSNKFMDNGFTAAYNNKDGYAITVNPYTGEKSMYVRGTTFKRGGIEWIQNLFENPLMKNIGGGSLLIHKLSHRIRQNQASYLSDIAKKNNVQTVYGHSRGAPLVADMYGNFRKVGVDGAMLISKRYPKSFNNFKQNQWFDNIIGARGRNYSVHGPRNPLSEKFHKAWK